MRRLRIGAVLLVVAAPYYASAAPAAGRLGKPAPQAAGAAPSRRAPAAAPATARSSAQAAGRYAAALDALQVEGRAATRGGKEAEIYKNASAGVVLVISKDGFGSGALIGADGKIITNLHVVGADEVVGVVFKPAVEGQEIGKADVRKALVLRRDEVADLALIQVVDVPTGLTPLSLGNLASIQVGSDVHAIGHPTGEAWTYTRGIVSQIRRDYAWHAEDKIPHKAMVIQTQTPINPGNSGGPLLDDSMTIVGLNSFVGDGEGLNYAVSVEEVKAMLARSEDRLIDPAVKAAAAKPCEPQTLDERRSDDPPGDEFLVDSDCDGVGETTVVEPDNKREPRSLYIDGDGDGNIDTVLVDEKRDGKFDYAYYDTDGNGKLDLEGKFRRGEDEPYRFERIREE